MLERLRGELALDRLSLHAVDPAQRSFRVLASAGDPLLGHGTELPTAASSQIESAAAGTPFRGSRFAPLAGFDRTLDRLVYELGFRSGCSLPVHRGGRVLGVLAASSRGLELDCDALLDALSVAGPPLAAALAAPHGPRVLVCHEDQFIATGITRMLERDLGAEVWICSEPRAALERGGEPFDAVVCDSFFDDGRLGRFLRDLRHAGASAPSLIVATCDSPLSRNLARLGGASAYGALEEGPAAILARVRALLAGEQGVSGLRTTTSRTHLTAQESRVLLLIEQGLRFKQIARELSITEATAKGHARSLFTKLGAHSRSEAVYEARRLGVLQFLRGVGRPVPVPAA
jgi:DNA-binding NarL/FixJ family response regulator